MITGFTNTILPGTLLLGVFSMLVALPAGAGELEDGLAAMEREEFALARELLWPLASEGDAVAAEAVGALYFYGLGIDQDHAEAFRWFRMSAEQGNAKGQTSLGLMYMGGWGTERDPALGFDWLKKAADKGWAPAQAELGLAYQAGEGVEQDYVEAVRLFRAAAEQGFPKAETCLALMYRQGLGVPRDAGEAMRWARRAADHGDPVAQHNMGASYAMGDEVPQDYAEALSWYRKAAEQGYAHSQWVLGFMYEEGQGVAPDIDEAMRWYRLAAEQGHPDAITRLRAVDEQAGRAGTLSDDDLLNLALEAPAIDLARSYLSLSITIDFLPLAESGAEINLGGEKITRDNVEQYRLEYERRLLAYSEAITRRGFADASGTYESESTRTCANINSTFSYLGGEEILSIRIHQDGFQAQLIMKCDCEGEEMDIVNRAIVAERAIAIMDAANSDYYFLGEIRDQAIIIKPDVSVLDSWPGWAGPPRREDLERCEIVLRRAPRKQDE